MSALDAYLESVIPGFSNAWDPNDINRLSLLNSPAEIFSNKEGMFKNDMHLVWLGWFVESIFNHRSADQELTYADVVSLVRRGMNKLGIEQGSESYGAVLAKVSDVSYNSILLANGRKRRAVTQSVKESLLERANNKPFCWICGHKFKDDALKSFLGERGTEIELPVLIDYMFKRGLQERDYKIEVEHKIPFSLGGRDIDSLDNIELSCGFCNRYKWKFLSIYDANTAMRDFVHPLKGSIKVPQPYWAIRVLALSNRCSHPGCTATKGKNDLYIDLINPLGAPVPTNLTVVCNKHLRSRGERFLSKEAFIN